MKTIQLLYTDVELRSFPPTTTLTFYNGNASSIETFLKQRVYEITELNPWLLGSIRFGTHLNLVYANDDLSNEFKRRRAIIIAQDSQLNECADYNDIAIRIESLNIMLNTDVVNKQDESLFRVCLIKISPMKFAILFSLNHILGDGHTFYQLYGMLNEQSKPRALIVDRLQEFDAIHEGLVGSETKYWFKPLFILKLVLKKLFCKPYLSTIHSVDFSAIEDLKLEYKKQSHSPEEFISTNDILTSWYFSKFKIDVGNIVVNTRDRLPQLTQDHAGNYQAIIMYQKGDFEQPSKIRESLKMLRRVNSDIPLTSSFQCAVSGKKFAYLTSWASTYMDVELPGCIQIIHFPIFLHGSLLQGGILFRANKDELKFLIFSKNKANRRRNYLLSRKAALLTAEGTVAGCQFICLNNSVYSKSRLNLALFSRNYRENSSGERSRARLKDHQTL